jgi:hypothetical protein
LDGLRQAPIFLADVAEGEDWVGTVRPFIQRRIQKFDIFYAYFFK